MPKSFTPSIHLIGILVFFLIISVAIYLGRQASQLAIQNTCPPQPENIEKTVFFAEQSYPISGRGVTLTGKLKSGTLRPGMKTTINGKVTRIIGNVEAWGHSYSCITSNDKQASNLAILLEGITKEDVEQYIQNKQEIIF